MFGSLTFGGGYFAQGPPGSVTFPPPPEHAIVAHPPIRVRNVTRGAGTLNLTAGAGRVRFSSGTPTIRNEEGSE